MLAQEMRFWQWWRAGVLLAGVREEDLPELSFPAELGGKGDRTAGLFEVILDPIHRDIRTSIQVREDLCSHTPLQIPGVGGDVLPLDVFAHAISGPAAVTDAVLMMALQCAHFEQFAWRYWEQAGDGESADHEAARRADWLVDTWAVGRAPYAPPPFARDTAPVRYAGRIWVVEDGWLVAKD